MIRLNFCQHFYLKFCLSIFCQHVLMFNQQTEKKLEKISINLVCGLSLFNVSPRQRSFFLALRQHFFIVCNCIENIFSFLPPGRIFFSVCMVSQSFSWNHFFVSTIVNFGVSTTKQIATSSLAIFVWLLELVSLTVRYY
jgi:hypothetical protein